MSCEQARGVLLFCFPTFSFSFSFLQLDMCMWRLLAVIVLLPLLSAQHTANDTARCLYDLEHHMTKKMIDATGKLPSGMEELNFRSLGSYHECLSNKTAAHYCVVSSAKIPLSWGICVPPSCTTHVLDENLYRIAPLLQNVSGIDVGYLYASCARKSDLSTDGGAIFVIVIASFIGLLVLLGTLIDVQAEFQSFLSTDFTLIGGDEREKEPLIQQMHDFKETREAFHQDLAYTKPESLPIRLLACFSLVRNVPKLCSTDAHKDSILCLNGIRTISMMWVVLGHTYFFFEFYDISNPLAMYDVLNRFSFQIVDNALFSVDSFFFLSGFLVALGCFKLLAKRGKLPWAQFYVARYLRLSPLYFLVLIFYIKIQRYLGQGPYWFFAQYTPDACSQDWWANLLYINNFYPNGGDVQNTCMGWTWYLANDMQFYIISPIFLLALHKSRRLGFAIWSVVLVVCTGITIGLAYKFKLTAAMTEAPRIGGGNQGTVYYVKPYCRIQPYLVGLLTGYFYFHHKSLPRFFTPVTLILGYIVCFAIIFFSLFGLTNGNDGFGGKLDQTSDALYLGFARLGWGVALGWIVYTSALGMGGIINNILASKIFIPLSRLTYAAYLIHPVVIQTTLSSYPSSIWFSDTVAVYFFLGHLGLTYLSAILLVLFAEMPFAQLLKFCM
eukprot:m.110468 g.110468  ORF g.110468 m.110468 type:complete len:668 (+) comp22721_c0_seq1:1-2004(+)